MIVRPFNRLLDGVDALLLVRNYLGQIMENLGPDARTKGGGTHAQPTSSVNNNEELVHLVDFRDILVYFL